jgi:hypothetical protein
MAQPSAICGFLEARKLKNLRLKIDLPVFVGTEQPETCRKCGMRTEFEVLDEQTQLHQCIRCGIEYRLEFDELVIEE